MKLLITGASGHLGCYLLREVRGQPFSVSAWSGQWTGNLFGHNLQPVDLTNQEAVTRAFHQIQPEVVVHTAALSAVGDCYRNPELARQINVDGTQRLAELCSQTKTRMIYTSTDMVFDGVKGNYNETEEANPLSIYGRSKREAEKTIFGMANVLIVRISLLFGPSLLPDRPAFFDKQVQSLRQGQPVRCFTDEWRTPLSLKTAAQTLLALISQPMEGLLHVGGPERLSRLDMGLRLARHWGVSEKLVVPIQREDIGAPEPRPRDASLDSRRWRQRCPDHPWPSWEDALWELSPLF